MSSGSPENNGVVHVEDNNNKSSSTSPSSDKENANKEDQDQEGEQEGVTGGGSDEVEGVSEEAKKTISSSASIPPLETEQGIASSPKDKDKDNNPEDTSSSGSAVAEQPSGAAAPAGGGGSGGGPTAKRKSATLTDGAEKPNGVSKKPPFGGQKTSKQLGGTEWWEIKDPNCDKPYFYSTKTHKTQWQNPLMNSEPKKKKQKTTATDGIPRGQPPRGGAGDKSKEKTSKQMGDSDWWVINDPAAERAYYYNAKTNKTQWIRPNVPEKKSGEKKTGLSEALESLAKRDTAVDKLRSTRQRGGKITQPTQSTGKTNKRIGNSDWYVINDASAGCVYYYNSKTEKTQWNVPPVAMNDAAMAAAPARATQNHRPRPTHKRSKQIGSSEWWKIDDPNAERPYYYNTATQKTQWTPPAIAVSDASVVSATVQHSGKKTSKQLGDSEWWMISDPNAAKPYYYNAVTQATQWQDPRKQAKPGRGQQRSKPKQTKSPLERIDVSDSSLNLGNLKCGPSCAAKAKAEEFASQLKQVKTQKQMWCKKYMEAQDQLSCVDKNQGEHKFSSSSSSSSSSQGGSIPPSIDNLVKPIPRDTPTVKQELFKTVEEASKERLLSALSISDLRQALSFKVELSSPYTAQIMYKYMFQAPLVKSTPGPVHPTHSAIGSRTRKRKIGDTDMDLPFPCFKCGLRFDTQQQILAHTRTHTISRLYSCPKPSCDSAFPDKIQLVEHAATHKAAGSSGSSSSSGNSGSNQKSAAMDASPPVVEMEVESELGKHEAPSGSFDLPSPMADVDVDDDDVSSPNPPTGDSVAASMAKAPSDPKPPPSSEASEDVVAGEKVEKPQEEQVDDDEEAEEKEEEEEEEGNNDGGQSKKDVADDEQPGGVEEEGDNEEGSDDVDEDGDKQMEIMDVTDVSQPEAPTDEKATNAPEGDADVSMEIVDEEMTKDATDSTEKDSETVNGNTGV